MRKVLTAALVAMLLMSASSWAEIADTPKRTLPHQEECATPLPTDFWDDSIAKSFEEAEAWAWNQRICLGRWADMRDAPGGSGLGEECQPVEIKNKGEAVPGYRELRPEFLELILSYGPWASAPRHPQVVIQCALVRGDIDWDDHEIAPSFGLYQSKIDGDVSLVRTKFRRTLSLSGSSVTGKLNADRLEVGGGLYLRDGAEFTDIDLLSATIGGNVEFSGSTVAGKLNADGLEVGGSLFMRDGAEFTDIDLLSATIGRNAEFSGSAVAGKLNADRLEVRGGLFMRDGATFVDVDLIGARIAGDVQLSGGDFAGKFNLTGAIIGGELHLSSGWRERSPTWQNGASLILRNARAGTLQAQGDSWTVSESDDLLKTDLTGFTYSGLEGLDTTGGASMGDESAEWLIGWIEAQRDYGDNYDPQPYTQLAQVLDAAGATDKAEEVRYARFEHKRAHDKSMSTSRRAWLEIERWVLGYGVYPIRVLYWFLGLVALGWLFVQFSKEPAVRRWTGLWYSFENALPLIETNPSFRDVEHGHPWLRHFFHVQKALGFLLATFLVGALTLLGG